MKPLNKSEILILVHPPGFNVNAYIGRANMKPHEVHYGILVNRDFELSRIVRQEPELVVIRGVPPANYAFSFIQALARCQKYPCDSPGLPMVMKERPAMVFCMESKAPLNTVSFIENIILMNIGY
jgi:hypothetical protein